MKKLNNMSYGKVAFYAILLELILVILQAGYIQIHNWTSTTNKLSFTTDYMMHTGFYVFLILGFFTFTVLTYIVLRNSEHNLFNKILVLFIAGGIVELGFYLFIQAEYQGAFLYSILDKTIAAGLGYIIYLIAGTKDTRVNHS